MKIPSTLGVFAALLAAPAAFGAASFEGMIRMKIAEARGKPHEIVQRLKEGFARIDVAGSRDESASIIFDYAHKEMIMLIPGQNMYMVRPLSDLAAVAEKAATRDDVSFERTAATEKILGYDCVKYEVRSPEGVTDLWVTDQLGSFAGLGAGGNPMAGMGGRGHEPPKAAWEIALAGKGFFPLRVVVHDAKGADKFRLDVVAIDQSAQPASVFAPPPGAQKLDLGGMMQGLFPPPR